MLGYLLLLLSLLFAAGMGIYYKLADVRGCRPKSINITLCFWAALFMWLYTFVFKYSGPENSIFRNFGTKGVLTAVLFGFFASVGLITWLKALQYGRITTSWALLNLATLVPAFLSIVLYKEWHQIKWQHPIALILVVISVLLFWRDKWLETERDVKNPRLDRNPSDAERLAEVPGEQK